MNFKYYDLLSNLTIGLVAFYAAWKLLFPEVQISEWVVVPAGYVLGYFLNALSSFVEPGLYKLIFGKPSDRLLTPVAERKWTGIRKVKFYSAEKAVEQLRKDVDDVNASTGKMFEFAMRQVSADSGSRVSDFNGHYALSRVVLTVVIIATVFVEIEYYDVWYSWIISAVVLFIAWNRYRERGYYYAREVLNEYLKMKK